MNVEYGILRPPKCRCGHCSDRVDTPPPSVKYYVHISTSTPSSDRSAAVKQGFVRVPFAVLLPLQPKEQAACRSALAIESDVVWRIAGWPLHVIVWVVASCEVMQAHATDNMLCGRGVFFSFFFFQLALSWMARLLFHSPCAG